MVRFLKACGNDRAGEIKPIDATRAKRLLRTGYIAEQATVSADENAARPKMSAPRPRAERRG